MGSTLNPPDIKWITGQPTRIPSNAVECSGGSTLKQANPFEAHPIPNESCRNYTGLTWHSLLLMWIAMQSTRIFPNATELSGEFTYSEVILLETRPIPNEFRRNHVHSQHTISIPNAISRDLCKFACDPFIFKGIPRHVTRICMECM